MRFAASSQTTSQRLMEDIFATTVRRSLRDRMQGYSKSGSIMALATKDVVTIPPTFSIKSAAELMAEHGFRRLPVCDSGSQRILGIIGSSDIVDLIGGGGKYQLISEVHSGNFLSAINDSVRRIMNTDVLSLGKESSGREALELIISSKRGGLVVLDKENRLIGMVTERDFIQPALHQVGERKVSEQMTPKVITATPGTTLGDAAKIMVRNSFRRLPVVSEDRLVGMVTTRTLIRFIGGNGVFEKLVKNDINEVLRARLSEFMNHQVVEVRMDAELREAIRLMLSTKEGTVCVVEEGCLKGILTERDVARSIAS